MDDRDYCLLKRTMLKLTGIDLDAYKSQQMRRRLEGFISRSDASGVVSFCHMLEDDVHKLDQLMDFLPINVSEFFRDTLLFQRLRDVVLPELMKSSPRLNIWSAACSCGQEPYSIAILLEVLSPHQTHRILATDMDQDALDHARQGGPYAQAEVKGVDAHLLRRFFVERDGGYWVADRLRSKVDFRGHNLLSDPFERGFDLVVCRNVIIYLSDQSREKLYREFNRSLNSGGVLFTGGTEVILRAREMGFENMGPSFYRKLMSNLLPLTTPT